MNFSGTLRLNKFACFTLVFILFVIIYWRSGGGYQPEKNDLSSAVNLKDLLKASIYVAELGGKKVSEGKDNDLNVKSKGKTKEGVNDPVTDADFASHCVMYNTLKSTFPNVAVISEEHSKEHACEKQEPLQLERSAIDGMWDEYVRAEDVTLWIDPLDATKEYTEGLYEYVTTMVCVAIKSVPVIGVIHYPFPHMTYWGWYTKRTSSNIHHVPHNEDAKNHPRVVVSRSHAGAVSAQAKSAFGADSKTSTAAGAGYKVMTVVNGTQDIYLHSTAIKKWDICAGNAIIFSVNGNMTMLNGERIDYSADSAVKVEGGLVASLYDHSVYLDKLKQSMGKT